MGGVLQKNVLPGLPWALLVLHCGPSFALCLCLPLPQTLPHALTRARPRALAAAQGPLLVPAQALSKSSDALLQFSIGEYILEWHLFLHAHEGHIAASQICIGSGENVALHFEEASVEGFFKSNHKVCGQKYDT